MAMERNSKEYFQIITTSGVPIYRQIVDQVKTLIAAGRLVPGEFLPSVRQVAIELEVNPMTVSKAYSLLEKDEVIEHVRGQGMAVGKIEGKGLAHVSQQEDILKPMVEELIVRAQQLSLNADHVKLLVDKIWEEKNK